MRARVIVCAALLAACGGGGDDDVDAPVGGADARALDGGDLADSPPAAAESEPNDGTSADDVDPVTFPGAIAGAIDPADDVDVFAAELPVGSRWTFRVEPDGAPTVPHLIVTNHADAAPTTLALGDTPGAGVELEQVIFTGGRHNFIVRDARNVPEPMGAGGPTATYTLTATPLERAPIAATIPSQPTGTLAHVGAVALYQFTLASETDVRIDVQARRLASPSDLDTRASLVRLADQAYLITNDDLTLGSQLDSRVEGVLEPGDYLLVIDNVDPAAEDLRYAVDFGTR